MLRNIHINRSCEVAVDKRYERNEKEDFKIAIDLLWEFRKKLDELHPMSVEYINYLLQERKY